MHATPPPRRSVLDSPWYWLYLFSAFGLALLVLNSGRYRERQAQIESSGLGRQAAAMQVRGKAVLPRNDAVSAPSVREPETRPLAIRLQPLLAILAGLVLIGGAGLAWQLSGRRAVAPADVSPTREATSDA